MEHKEAKALAKSLESVSQLPCHLVKDPSGGYIIQVQKTTDARYPAWTLFSPNQVLGAMDNFAQT